MTEISPRIHYEDPRYPTLIIEHEGGTMGWELNLGTLTLRRVCICFAHCDGECVCGYYDDKERA